jgi:hypothetical protein
LERLTLRYDLPFLICAADGLVLEDVCRSLSRLDSCQKRRRSECESLKASLERLFFNEVW